LDSQALDRPLLSGLSVYPVDLIRGWTEREGIFLVIGWLGALSLWWMLRHSYPVTSWNGILGLIYLAGCGACLGHLAYVQTRFFWTRNLGAGVDSLVLWLLVLVLTAQALWFYAVGTFLVYALMRSLLRSSRDWLSSAAIRVSTRSESEKSISRPYVIPGCLTLACAASFSGFLEICERYGRWLARKGLIYSWETASHSVTYFLGSGWINSRLVRKDHATSWIRVDNKGRCTVFLCRRDLNRFGGRKYTAVCKEFGHAFCESFYSYVLERTPLPPLHASSSG